MLKFIRTVFICITVCVGGLSMCTLATGSSEGEISVAKDNTAKTRIIEKKDKKIEGLMNKNAKLGIKYAEQSVKMSELKKDYKEIMKENNKMKKKKWWNITDEE